MDESLDDLMRRGRALLDRLAAESNGEAPNGEWANSATSQAARVWQHDCAATVGRLSGGSKAHWLARAYSDALLVRTTTGPILHDVKIDEIVGRVLDLLERARTSLERSGGLVPSSTDASADARRFEFVSDAHMRPILARAYVDSRRALELGCFAEALVTSCGILEAIITDALEQRCPDSTTADDRPPGMVVDWPFETRIAVAEKRGLIRNGCARLPAVARQYRELANTDGELGAEVTVAERDARLTNQVLHVVMRDLDPGR